MMIYSAYIITVFLIYLTILKLPYRILLSRMYRYL